MIKFKKGNYSLYSLFNKDVAMFKSPYGNYFIYCYFCNREWKYLPASYGYTNSANKRDLKLAICNNFNCESWNYEILY
jgi:hypothetical protein